MFGRKNNWVWVLDLFTSTFPGRTSTIVNDRLRRNTTKYLAPYYDRKSPCRIRSNTTIYGEKYDRLRFSYTKSVYGTRFAPYFSVYDRLRLYTATTIYDRNTEPGITVKYDRKRSYRGRIRSFTIVYEVRNRRPGFSATLCSEMNIFLKLYELSKDM